MNRPSIAMLLFVLAAIAISPFTTRAAELRAGDRVRVNTTGDNGKSQVIGTVVSMDDATLVVQTSREHRDLRDHETPAHEDRTIPLRDVTSVDLWAGKKNHTFAGALIGAAGGLVIGLATRESSQTEGTEFGGGSDASGLATVLLTIVGAGAGAFVGHFVTTDQWEPVESLAVEVTPSSEGAPQLALTVSLDF